MKQLRIFYKNLRHALLRAIRPMRPPPIEGTFDYAEIRPKLKTGDIIAVARGNGVSFTDKIFGLIISRLTGYHIYHVGTIIVVDGRYFVIEAIMPRVRLSLLSTRTPFYHIPVATDKSSLMSEGDFLTDAFKLLGKKYSLLDVLRSYWEDGLPDDNGVQCVEMTNYLHNKYMGIDLPHILIPGEFVRTLMYMDYKLNKVTKLDP